MVLEQDLGAVLEAIVKEVEATNAGIVVVDSFRTRGAQGGRAPRSEMELQGFVQRLALHLTSWQATTFLVGEYVEGELRDNPVFTVADGLLWLSQSVERNSIVRKLQVMKMRGQESVPGLHTFRITDDGLQAFPRTFGLERTSRSGRGPAAAFHRRPELDAMLGGGIPEGDSLLLAGPSGTGKSMLATQFIAEGLRQGEPGIIAIFEERPDEYVQRAATFGLDFDTPQETASSRSSTCARSTSRSTRRCTRSSTRSSRSAQAAGDRLAGRLRDGAGARLPRRLPRVALPDDRRADPPGVTILSTVEIEEDFTAMDLSHYTVSFLTDDIVRLRYV